MVFLLLKFLIIGNGAAKARLLQKRNDKDMKTLNIRNSLILLLTATIWGTAFVAQSLGMNYLGPFTFNMVRCIIGGLVLIPVILVFDKISPKKKQSSKALISGGIICGILLFLASNFQQIGIKYTTVGRAGFITACYILIVPILSQLFFKKKCGINIWIAVFIALAGLYLLCINEGFSVGKGDLLVLICSVLFSFHILAIDHFSPLADGVKMSCIQFFVCGILCIIPALLTEEIIVADIFKAKLPVLYSGVLSCGVAYTLQIIGQKNMNPAIASLILSLESCISVIAGWLILNQHLSKRELIGCGFMFAAIILAQLPNRAG